MSILNEILASKQTEIDCAKRKRPLADLTRQAESMPATRGFAAALRGGQNRPTLVAEVKKASPSKGVIREQFDPVAIALAYESAGADCISVLTDGPFFMGSLEHLQTVRGTVDLPLLRKDFIVNEYQIVEARAFGADAVLLIAAALCPAELSRLLVCAAQLGLEALVEVHNRAELDECLSIGATVIGINNRDLHTFRTSLETTLALMPHIPEDRIVVSESGITTRAHLDRLADAGVTSVLVGEALMREPDVAEGVRKLMCVPVPLSA